MLRIATSEEKYHTGRGEGMIRSLDGHRGRAYYIFSRCRGRVIARVKAVEPAERLAVESCIEAVEVSIVQYERRVPASLRRRDKSEWEDAGEPEQKERDDWKEQAQMGIEQTKNQRIESHFVKERIMCKTGGSKVAVSVLALSASMERPIEVGTYGFYWGGDGKANYATVQRTHAVAMVRSQKTVWLVEYGTGKKPKARTVQYLGVRTVLNEDGDVVLSAPDIRETSWAAVQVERHPGEKWLDIGPGSTNALEFVIVAAETIARVAFEWSWPRAPEHVLAKVILSRDVVRETIGGVKPTDRAQSCSRGRARKSQRDRKQTTT
ncbi:hypothetical protein FB45DRAFT_1006246 [Roridomyces roridus]|uniref:Uncharacterized protein n=1 Tax=Roridomyces roridus TaxID=1738132 RepID=A0AAD7BIS4_9AGAR|nr:hypothetical protein FB45DRAFT_1006246 [Roridomyces roridus]